MKVKIELETMKDVRDFVNIATTVPARVTVTDGAGLTVNAKSMMGMLYSLEFEDLWCESEVDFSMKIIRFID